MKSKCNNKVFRIVAVNDNKDQDAVCKLNMSMIFPVVAELRHKFEHKQLEPHMCTVTWDSMKYGLQKTPIRFTNIVGQINHYDNLCVLQEHAKLSTHHISDAFGEFICLYSPLSNLRISVNFTNTLFRGGNSSRDIQELIDHSIKAETVHNITVHMFVATCRLGRPVARYNEMLTSALTTPNWSLLPLGDDGELTNYRGVLLQDISEPLAKQLGLPEVPSSMRVNITRTGCVNMFLSLRKHVGFCQGIEHRFLAIFQHVVDIIDSVT